MDIVCKFFFSVTGRPVLAGIKLLEAGSDFLYQRSTGQFWRVFNIAEDYYLSGWVQAFAALQNNPPQGAVIALVDSGLLLDAEADALRTKFHIGEDNEQEPTEPDTDADTGNNAENGANNAPATSNAEHDTDYTSDTCAAESATAIRGSNFWSY